MWDLREYIKHTDISITPVTGEETENGAEEMGEGMRIPRRVSPQNPEVLGRMSTEKWTRDTEATARQMLWLHSQHWTPTDNGMRMSTAVKVTPAHLEVHSQQKWRGNRDLLSWGKSSRTDLHYRKCYRNFLRLRRKDTGLNTRGLQNGKKSTRRSKELNIWVKRRKFIFQYF